MTGTEACGKLLDAMEAAGVEYMVTGAFASNAYGIPRSTKDADFVVDHFTPELNKVLDRLGPGIVLQEQMSFETITGSWRQILDVPGTSFVIELFQLGDDPFMQERFRRRVRVGSPDWNRLVWMPTAEDVVIQKLRWGREKDLTDARDVLAVQGDALDFVHLERWCAEHGTVGRLAALRASVEGI